MLDHPVSNVYCKDPGEELWLTQRVACRKARKVLLCAHIICILYESDQRCVWWTVPASWICRKQCSACILIPFGPELQCCVVPLSSILPGYFLLLWPLLNKPQLICFNVLKETGKWRRENKRTNTKTAEERDNNPLGQRRKEMKLGIRPVCALLDLCSCFIYFISGKR